MAIPVEHLVARQHHDAHATTPSVRSTKLLGHHLAHAHWCAVLSPPA